MTQIFYTHNNGTRPFKVVINKNLVNVFSHYKNKKLLTFNAKKVFIGESPKNEMTTFSNGYGKDFLGNSILLKLDDNKYEFIGNFIFSFTTHSEIISFVSPVGNNDVPYPYAIDKDGNIYLMIENVILKYNKNLNKLIKKYDDPYSYYYKANLITLDIRSIPPKKPLYKICGDDIIKYYIDDDQYTLTYTPNPKEDYNRLIPAYGKHMYIVDSKNNKLKLTQKKYIKLMNNFGKCIGVEEMINVNIDINE
jgi:hypothetical protein